MGQVIRITVEDLNEALARKAVSSADVSLLARMSEWKQSDARPMYLRLDFPADGGVEVRAKRGELVAMGFDLSEDVELWKQEG